MKYLTCQFLLSELSRSAANRTLRRGGTIISQWVNRFTFCRSLALVLLTLSGLVSSVASASDNEPGQLKLIELYTSHGCSSCPSADKLLGELLDQHDDLLALEFHVDYWNNLVHGRDGNFVDPFSDAQYSMRQRQYNAAKLAGRPGVYTPQAVINGRFAAVGSNRRHIGKALSRPVDQALQLHIEPGESANTLSVRVSGSAEQRNQLRGTDILLATYIDQATTEITGGENRNRSLTNHHIVTSLTALGEVSADAAMVFSLPRPEAGEGCVVLVQEDALTPIYAAVACP